MLSVGIDVGKVPLSDMIAQTLRGFRTQKGQLIGVMAYHLPSAILPPEQICGSD